MNRGIVFFDVGGVLVNYSRQKFSTRLSEKIGAARDALGSSLERWLADVRCRDDGSLRSDEMACHLGGTTDFELCLRDAYAEASSRNEAGLQLLRWLVASHVRCGIISNTNRFHWKWVQEHVPEIRSCYPIVLSFQARCAKPQSDIFKLAVKLADCPGERVFLVDDEPQNVEAAAREGMVGFKYEGVRTNLDVQRRMNIATSAIRCS